MRKPRGSPVFWVFLCFLRFLDPVPLGTLRACPGNVSFLEFGPGYFSSAGCLVIEISIFNRDSLLFSQLSALSADSESLVFMFSRVFGSYPLREL